MYSFRKNSVVSTTFMSCDDTLKKRTNTKKLTKYKHDKYVHYRTDTNESYIHQTASDALY